ncbi:MAG: hypothetical protein CR968_02825 [Flavobacteriia bacterium]|nr:MAG: hypothetical protein CR968_02825 [Flavobacteriia bacterium]
MNQFSLLSLHHLEKEIKSAVDYSVFSFQESSTPEAWARHTLKTNVENSLNKLMKQNVSLNSLQGAGSPPPDGGMNGFRATIGLQVLLGFKVRFKVSANLGYGYRSGNFGATTSLHFAAYNDGLGVGVGNKNMVVDVTAAVNLTIGGGNGTPLQSYALNYNSPIPNLNTFKNSFSYGQLLTWNSALNQNQFSLNDIQREGMIGFRLGDVNVSSNNDTKRFYFGDGGDRAWTGGISIVTPLFEIGFQDFSGKYIDRATTERNLEKYRNQIRKIENDIFLSRQEKKDKISSINEQIRRLTNNHLHTQTEYQKNLNKASTYFRVNKDGYNTTIDVIGDAWLQNLIHRAIKDLRFDYQYKTIKIWGGKDW